MFLLNLWFDWLVQRFLIIKEEEEKNINNGTLYKHGIMIYEIYIMSIVFAPKEFHFSAKPASVFFLARWKFYRGSDMSNCFGIANHYVFHALIDFIFYSYNLTC